MGDIDKVQHKRYADKGWKGNTSLHVDNTLAASSRPLLKTIKNNALKKKQDLTKIETPQLPMDSISVTPAITKKMNSEFFLFIIVYTYQTQSSQDTPDITQDIVSTFETDIDNIDDFTLGKTYAGNVAEIEYNMNIQNYITVKKEKLFQTRIEKRKTPPQFNVMSNYYVYKNFENIVQIEENQCIFFYIYNKKKEPQKIYYTKGSIFFYENGFGSTRSINIFEGNINENNKIAKIILESNYYSKKKEGQHGGLNKDQILRLLKEKCKNINFLYANTILPSALYDILEKNNNDTLIIIKNIISQLYINIGTPDDDLTKIQNYNYLYTKIYEYYYNKNVTNNEYNNELKKEIKQFIQIKIPLLPRLPYQNLKINKYINLLNDINHSRNMTKRYEYLSFSMHTSDFLDFLIRNTDPRIFTIIENMQISSLITDIDKTKIPQFLPRIKQKIEDTTKGVYTYLKVTNFHHVPNSNNRQSFNERFEIQMHNDTRSIILQNSNIHFPFYTKDLKTDSKKIKDSRDNRITLKMEKINGNEIFLDEIDTITYDGTYIFGNFNKVFPPSDTIANITHSLQPLIDKVIAKKPVFLLGWGASGSGKTSTLISLIKKNEPGILIYLCNELGMKGYTNLQIICKEFFQPYYDYDYDGKSYVGNIPAIIESVPFIFDYNAAESNISNKFKLKNEVTHRSKHQYRPNPAITIFNQGENIGNIVKYLIDDDRLVKATTNNPNSSRSHVLCFLKFTKSDGTKGHIVIGDMAGVENRFNCSSPVEISNFFNIKRDGQKESFYKNEITNKQHDFINGGNAPYTFKNDEETKFKQSFSSGFFRFDNEDKLLELYKHGQSGSLFGRVTFSSPKTGIKQFVNLILQKIGLGSFTTDNLNSEILKKESVTKIEAAIGAYKFVNNLDYNDKTTLKKIVCGTMNKKYEDPSCGNQSSIWTSEVVNVLIQKLKECILYNKVIKQSCEHRVTEGTYINDSLHKLSTDIINIISFKNQNTVYYLPSFVDKCLPAYCPSQSTCFSMTAKKSDPQIESTILISIYEYLNDGKKYDIIAERESVTKFYNDIEICVFCVFNWSRSANNPPPVPYVDINDLKQMVYKKESFTIQEFQSLINLKISQLKKDKMYFNTAIETLTEILAIKEINSNTIDKDIKPKLESIEKTNATTAIGTIEFTDRIGKLNTISNSCSINSSKDNNYAYIYPKPPKRNKK